jgi:site-specific recombinase XerD
MASLYRKTVIRLDETTGRKVKTKSKKWWGQYKDALGRLRRVPLSVDKQCAQTMLTRITRQVERERAGLVDPTEEQRKRPLAEHLNEFEGYLRHRGVTPKQVAETMRMLRRIATESQWRRIADISATAALEFLGGLRRNGLSAQTYNHYLKAAKQFTRWLVRDHRTPLDPLAHLSRLNILLDRRHDRRALSPDEFARLVAAARSGKRIEGMHGPDRAMLYIVAAWTGFRKAEIGSLTLRCFRLDDDPPTATVAACYSKHRRQDTQILHPELVRQLKAWLASKRKIDPDKPLFSISRRFPGGIERKTYKMIELDLRAARDKWLDEVTDDPAETQRRLKTDFLCYCNHDGLFADFHSLRHLFITNLERAGLSPKMAQTLARHSDIRLTLGVYTHVGLHDQSAAINTLPGPPTADGATGPAATADSVQTPPPRGGIRLHRTGTDG